jgi:hypothetical protein
MDTACQMTTFTTEQTEGRRSNNNNNSFTKPHLKPLPQERMICSSCDWPVEKLLVA